jgi:sugar/nucleoside kinase (ribokinase family)
MNASTVKEGAPRRWLLLSIGDPVADIAIAATPPALGEKVLGRRLGMLAGGTTANVGCAVARLGLPSAIFGRVGDDAPGQMLHASFGEFGVDTDYLRRAPGAQSASVIMMVAPCGEKSMIYLPMETEPLEPLLLSQALAQSRVTYTMPYDLEQYQALSVSARQQGTLVAIDLEAAVAPDGAAMRERVARADIVFFNQTGFEAGAGCAPSFAAMRALLALGPSVVVVSLGAAGALAVTADEEAAQAAFPAEVVDTTGAGDSFNAAFLVAWMDGGSLRQALRFACAAASRTVAALGARTALPDRATVLAVLAGEAAGEAP